MFTPMTIPAPNYPKNLLLKMRSVSTASSFAVLLTDFPLASDYESITRQARRVRTIDAQYLFTQKQNGSHVSLEQLAIYEDNPK